MLLRVAAAFCCCLSQVAAAPASTAAAPPQALFPGLYEAVEAATLFSDSKTFADAFPRQSAAVILRDYRRQRPRSKAALGRFVALHFTLPSKLQPATATVERTSIVEHIDGLWNSLTRETDSGLASSLLPLPHPYVVPGGRFRELYYWDSYFTMLGLEQSGRLDLVADMVDDFAYLIDRFGHVPNGTRTYYLSRSQPPFFFEMVALLPSNMKSPWVRYLPQLRREHDYWMRGSLGLTKGNARRRVVAMADGTLLNRYWDDSNRPRDESYREDLALARRAHRDARRLFRDIRAAAESGWDFSSRWFADSRHPTTIDTTEIVPVDLNSLMFGLEIAISSGCSQIQDVSCATEFAQHAAARRRAMDRYLWDAASGVYLDYRWTLKKRTPLTTAATLYPLFVGAASPVQAADVARSVEHRLLKMGGIAASTIDTGQQWDSPNGWAPLQWIAIDGMRRYGEMSLAATIACRWMHGVALEYRESGKLVEKYDVVDAGHGGGGGEYPTQDGFGWTNGVMRRLTALYPAAANEPTSDCGDAAATDASHNVK